MRKVKSEHHSKSLGRPVSKHNTKMAWTSPDGGDLKPVPNPRDWTHGKDMGEHGKQWKDSFA